MAPVGGLEPRLRASWQPFGRASEKLQGAFGLYRQNLVGVSDIRDVTSAFTAWLRAPDNVPVKVMQGSLGWQQSLENGLRVSLEWLLQANGRIPGTRLARDGGIQYAADARQRRILRCGHAPRIPEPALLRLRRLWLLLDHVRGDAAGVRVLVRHRGAELSPAPRPAAPAERRGEPRSWQASRLAGRWQFGSGLPFTRPLGFDEAFNYPVDLYNVSTTYGTARVLLDRPFNGRLPMVHRLDVSLERCVRPAVRPAPAAGRRDQRLRPAEPVLLRPLHRPAGRPAATGAVRLADTARQLIRERTMSQHCPRLVPGLLVALFASACDDSFEPIDPSGPAFSVFGYLDAGADTQWIRVKDLHHGTLVNSREPTGVTVTLQQLGTGKTMALPDTALLYGSMLGPQTAYAHNHWTTERIEPGASYRFRAESRDGSVAESVVRIPPDYHLEVWTYQPTASQLPAARRTYLRVEGVEQLPFIFWFKSHDEECYASKACRVIAVLRAGGDVTGRMYEVDPQSTLEAMTVAAGAAWPFDMDFSVKPVPDSTSSNITGALGFLGGVLTKKIWTEECALPYPSPPDTYCKLHYDATAATLRGRIGSACAFLREDVLTQLRELEPPAGERPRTRFGVLDPNGNFEIGAIRPGWHELSVTHPGFVPHTDTLQLAAGQRSAYFASIGPAGDCPQ